MRTILPDSASFLVSEDCNLACTYCFERGKHKHKKMSKEVAARGLLLLCLGAKEAGKDNFHALIFGGEPLLAPDIIEYIFQEGLRLEEIHGIKFTSNIITNATIFTPEIEKILTKYRDKVNLSMQLSVDGIQQVQDRYRIYKSGKGSFETVEQNILKFKALFNNKPHYLNVHGCLNKESLPFLWDSFRLFYEDWGIKNTWFMPVHEEKWSDDDVEIYHQQLNKIADFLLQEVKKENSLQPIRNYSPINRCLLKDVMPTTPCGAGRGFVTFTANGDIYPCHNFYFQFPNELKIGDVFRGIDDSKRRMFLDYSNKDMSCGQCEHSHCYRCIAVNYTVNGSIFSQVRGVYCKMSKIDREVQEKVKKEVEKLGLIHDGPRLNPSNKEAKFAEAWISGDKYYERWINPDGTSSILDSNRQPGDCPIPSKECEQDTSNPIEILAAALKTVIQKVDDLEKKVDELGRR